MQRYAFLFLLVFSVASCQSGKSLNSDVASGTQADLESNVGDYVLFEVNSSGLDSEASSTLDKQITWLKEHGRVKVIIEGHCDARGTRDYNIALGAKRASTVRAYLISGGVHPSRISTISYGKERAPVHGSGEEIWRQNRRAITVVTD